MIFLRSYLLKGFGGTGGLLSSTTCSRKPLCPSLKEIWTLTLGNIPLTLQYRLHLLMNADKFHTLSGIHRTHTPSVLQMILCQSYLHQRSTHQTSGWLLSSIHAWNSLSGSSGFVCSPVSKFASLGYCSAFSSRFQPTPFLEGHPFATSFDHHYDLSQHDWTSLLRCSLLPCRIQG